MRKELHAILMFAGFTMIGGASLHAQVTRVITDFNGYWSSSSATHTPYLNNRANVIGFTYNGVVYSTGVNDPLLTANVASFVPADFRSVPLGTLPGNTQASYFLTAGTAVDGDAATRIYAPVANTTTRDALTDGIKGLDLGTSITNITSSVVFNIPINNIVSAAIADGAPDILFAAVGTPSLLDTYVFTNEAGVTVGNSVSYNLVSTNSPIIGTANLDLFAYSTGVAVDTALPISTNGQTGTREIRIAGLQLSQFGITNANKDQVRFLKITPGGGSDPAFIAYNAGSFTPRIVWQGDVSSDWNTPGNWLNNIVATSTIDAYIPAVTSPNVYPLVDSATAAAKNINISSGASVTVSQSGRLEIAGSIANQGTFNVTDGSLGFIGSAAQVIPAGAFEANTLKNLTISNTSGVTLQGAANLTGILSLQSGTFNTGNFLTLKSNASGSAVIAPVMGAVAGEMTIERFIPARRAFRFLSSPVDGGTIRTNWQENGAEVSGLGTDITGAGGATNGFDPSGSNNASMFTYWNQNPGTGTSWQAVGSTNIPLVAGAPYRILVRGDRTINLSDNDSPATNTTLRSTGTIRTGDVVVTDLSGGQDKFSLIGNPYQAPVDMQAVLDNSTLIKKTFYTIWDPTVSTRGAYVTVVFANPDLNNFEGSQANRFLQPGQAAFVQGSDNGAASITFMESHKNVLAPQTPVFRQSSETNTALIRGTLYNSATLASNGPAADGFLVSFSDEYSNEVNQLDAIKAGNQDENAGIMNSGKILSFETRSLPVATDVIPLSNNQYRSTSYTYKMTVSGLTGVTALLLDKYTNTTHELANDQVTEVAFTVNASDAASIAANRFDIIFEDMALGNTDSAFANAVRLYPNPTTSGAFSIALPSAETVKVIVTSILGQEVLSSEFTPSQNIVEITPNQSLQAGVYLVQVSSQSGTTVKKLIVK